MAANFYPPQLNPFLVRLAQSIAPVAIRSFYQFELAVSSECLEQIRALKHQRLLLLPNHPTFQDPIVLFALSALRETFYYLAADELFNSSLSGVFQRLGVYSIRRGLVDRPSIAQTLALLTQPDCRLVIFPEGGCSFQNDVVMPFRVGAVQIAFQALSKLVKQGEPLPNLYVLPVSIKYRYTQDMSQAIAQMLSQLEQALNLISTSSPYQRLRAVAEQVLVKVEQDYELDNSENDRQSWEQRISQLRISILKSCEQQLGIASNPKELVRERTYRIKHMLKLKADALESDPAKAELDILEGKQDSNLKLIEKSVKRLLNFDAIYDGYVAENPTSERFIDTLIRLEREVFDIDQPPPKGYRRVRIKTGEPVNLKDGFADYQRDGRCANRRRHRTQAVNSVTLKIQQSVQDNLNLLQDEAEWTR